VAAAVVVASNIGYLPFGPIGSVRFGNGQLATLTYDQDYRLTDLVTTDGTTGVQDLDYGFDDASNISAVNDALDTSVNQTFAYDALHRLTDAGGAYGDIDYAYDAVGNRTSRTVDLGTPETLTYATTSNRLLSVSGGATRTLTYTADGSVATDSRGAGFAFTYNHASRLVRVDENSLTVAEYLYNDLGQRVVKDLGTGGVTHYHYDRSGVAIAESAGGTGAVTREYIHLATRAPITRSAPTARGPRPSPGRRPSSPAGPIRSTPSIRNTRRGGRSPNTPCTTPAGRPTSRSIRRPAAGRGISSATSS
jgi:YD repeat-containing protein